VKGCTSRLRDVSWIFEDGIVCTIMLNSVKEGMGRTLSMTGGVLFGGEKKNYIASETRWSHSLTIEIPPTGYQYHYILSEAMMLSCEPDRTKCFRGKCHSQMRPRVPLYTHSSTSEHRMICPSNASNHTNNPPQMLQLFFKPPSADEKIQ
jgi:hypothetical protein